MSAAETIDLTGTVAIVTGAGRGLGRAYAVELARRGARVVVNDPGQGVRGDPSAERPAAEVVAEICAGGGVAVEDGSDIGNPDGAESLVANALESFGQIDALVNNAGIMRDRSFAKMDLEDFDQVLQVHLSGAAYVTRNAWSSLCASVAGRIVFITSAVGLYGGFGQANYAAAKAGVVGLMNTLAIEGERTGTLVNAVAPVARSRMSEDLVSDAVARGLAPELVAPVVTYLCSPSCRSTGLVLEVGAGLVARARVVEGEGVWIEPGAVTCEEVARRFDEIEGMAESRAYGSSDEALKRVFDRAQELGKDPM